MAPMARTNRKDPSLNALDDLNLDDMFEGGQDGLFDELGMDLGELGDITSNENDSAAVPPVPKGLDDMQFDLLGDIGVDDGVTAMESIKKSRRKTKRKVKGTLPYEEEDADEDEPSKKKRKCNKKTKTTATTGSLKKTTKIVVEESSIPSTVKTKTKVKTDVASPTVERGAAQNSMVAAAGRFGGQHKRSQYPSLPRAGSKNKAKATPSIPAIPAPAVPAPKAAKVTDSIPTPPTAKRNRSIPEVPKPLETLFCGLEPSNSLFYPFLPSLPQEVSMKKSNKFYPVLDKINAALNATTPGPDVDDPLLRLLMFHDPVPTKDKKLVMAASVISSRKSVQAADRQRLVTDLQAVATLVKRQHDFLARSLDNMERWCKTSFSGDDYRAVYGGVKPKPLLTQLSSPVVRVRIRCNGFKEPKVGTMLIAHVPLPGNAKATTAPSTTTTKRKRVETATSSSVSDKVAAAEHPVLKYADLPPNGRRQFISDLIVKHAQLLESKQAEMDEARRKALEKQKQVLQKVVDDDDLIALNTTTLWKWVEKAGYMADFTEQDLRELLIYEPEVDKEHLLWENCPTKKKSKLTHDSLYERLQSLLVEVSDDEDDDDETNVDDDEEDDNEDDEVDMLWATTNVDVKSNKTLLDLSQLSIEERAYIHLRAAGLIEESLPPPDAIIASEIDEDDVEEDTAEFEELLRRMKTDLLRMNRVNNSRTAFLEFSARAHLKMSEQLKREDERQSHLIAKCNQVVKKQKETKRTARQKGQKKDEDWPPW